MSRSKINLWLAALVLSGVLVLGCHFPQPVAGPPDPRPFESASQTPQQQAASQTSTATEQTPAPSPTHTATQTETPPRLTCEGQACLDPGVTIDFLIVTRPLFVPALTGYINWKAASGFQVGLVTVEWLAESFQGRHLAEQMKTGMHEIRRNHTPDGRLYVLLVGDTEIERANFHVDAVLASYTLAAPWNVPTGFYRRVSTDPPGDILPGDAYFTEDRDWDPDNTGLNPVPDQEWGQGTMDPTIYLGRWSVRAAGELPPIINKTMQVTPTNRLLITGEGSFYEHVSCCTSLPPSGYSGNNSYACCYIDTYFAYQSMFESDTPWLDITFTDVPEGDQAGGWAALDEMENFDGVISSLYHGNYDCIAMSGAGCLTINDFNFNVSPPLLEAGSCYIGAFYSSAEDTLAESFHKLPVGPAIMTQAGHNYYVFMDNLRQGMPAGDAFWRAAAEYVYWPNMMLFLGDPSLPVLLGP